MRHSKQQPGSLALTSLIRGFPSFFLQLTTGAAPHLSLSTRVSSLVSYLVSSLGTMSLASRTSYMYSSGRKCAALGARRPQTYRPQDTSLCAQRPVICLHILASHKLYLHTPCFLDCEFAGQVYQCPDQTHTCLPVLSS